MPPFEIKEITSAVLYLDGKEIVDVTDASIPLSTDESIYLNVTTPIADSYNYNIDYDWNPISTITFDACEINYDIMEQICGLRHSPNDNFTITYPVKVQARKHRKRRINKKWLKRYGYKTVMRKSDGWELNGYIDGTFELINRTRGD